MNTGVLEKPAAVAKSSKTKAADVILNKGKSKAAEKADLKKHASEIEAKAAEQKPAKSKPATVKAPKPAPKTKEPKARKISAMWVIRSNMAESLATNGEPATVEMISKACAAAGVPKKDDTIRTIISDFMQTLQALQQAGLVKTFA